jgi:hypothetical protein
MQLKFDLAEFQMSFSYDSEINRRFSQSESKALLALWSRKWA